ncbi:MAG: nitrous oxide reductase family maturation protein NosD [Armatimonadota bacterium]|nr:nitrous oxide reductase family maturation protein NosD [Armatimonadota bacterium]
MPASPLPSPHGPMPRAALAVAAGLALSVGVAAAAGPPATAAPSLQTRIDAAPPGATVTVRGVEQGPVVISKPLRLVGEPGAVIDGGGRGTVVRVTAPGVILSRLSLRRSGTDLNEEDAGVALHAPDALLEDLTLEEVLFGLNLKRADRAVIRRVTMRGYDLPPGRRGDAVRLWYSQRVVLSDVRIRRLRDVLIWFSRSSVLHALDVASSRYGVHLMYADDLRLLEGTFTDNAVGAYVMYSSGVRIEGNRFLRHRGSTGVGLAFKESDDVVARGNLLAGNHVGLYLDGTPLREGGRSEISGNTIAGNETGIVLLSSASGNVIVGNRFDHNARQVRLEGGAQAVNLWARAGRGNYWSDHVALDADGDGVADLPYRAQEWFERLEDRLPAAALFWGSTAVAAVDFASRLLPLFPPHVLVEDPSPLMALPVVPEHRGEPASPPFAAASALLALGGGATLWRTGAPRRFRREKPR